MCKNHARYNNGEARKWQVFMGGEETGEGEERRRWVMSTHEHNLSLPRWKASKQEQHNCWNFNAGVKNNNLPLKMNFTLRSFITLRQNYCKYRNKDYRWDNVYIYSITTNRYFQNWISKVIYDLLSLMNSVLTSSVITHCHSVWWQRNGGS